MSNKFINIMDETITVDKILEIRKNAIENKNVKNNPNLSDFGKLVCEYAIEHNLDYSKAYKEIVKLINASKYGKQEKNKSKKIEDNSMEDDNIINHKNGYSAVLNKNDNKITVFHNKILVRVGVLNNKTNEEIYDILDSKDFSRL